MKRVLVIAAFCAGALLAAGTFAAAQESASPVDSLREGKTSLEKKCKLCHSLRLVLGKVKTRDEWDITVKRMVTFGAPLNASERTNVTAYLSARSTFENSCSRCHEPTKVVPDDDADRDWPATVKRMSSHIEDLEAKGEGKGATKLTEAEIEEIAAFLSVILGEN